MPKKTHDQKTIDLVAKLAADLRISYPMASQRTGLSVHQIKTLIKNEGLRWVPYAPHLKEGYAVHHHNVTECFKTGYKPKREQVDAIAKPAPKVKIPTIKLESHLGGWRWDCPDLGLSGWRPGKKDQVREKVKEDVARIVDRTEFHSRVKPGIYKPVDVRG